MDASHARRRLLTVAAAAATLAIPAAAGAAPLTGTVAGTTGGSVLAIAPSGDAVRAPIGTDGGFSLALSRRFKGATLHVVDAGGGYAGPVVLRARGGRAYTALAVTRGRLGTLAAKGGWYAARGLRPRFTLGTYVLATRTGRPLGAGRLGLVTVKKGRKAGIAAAGPGDGPGDGGRNRPDGGNRGGGGQAQPGGDTDRDGLPNALDADDNGNGVLDGNDPTAGSDTSSGLFTTVKTRLDTALNANAAGVTREQIDGLVSGDGTFNLAFYVDPAQFRGTTITSGHVECGTLAYCRVPDGTAVISGMSESSPSLPRGDRWATWSPDGSGYPNLERLTGWDGRASFAMGVQPRVGTDAIRPGDVMDVVFATSTGIIRRPTTLAPYFVTVPAVSAWSSGSASGTVTYPMPPGAAGASEGNPLLLGDGTLTLTFWRPQRLSVPGAETGEYQDLGHLNYGISYDGQSRQYGCRDQISGLSPTLSRRAGGTDDMAVQLFPLKDSAADAPADPAKTLTFTVDLAACLTANGQTAAGATVTLDLTAAGEDRPGGNDRASQKIVVRLP
ncbi:MAG: hypothetical protein U0237_04405 [Thermoleophilia bacterium]